MKKILFLAPASNYHTKKWCAFFFERGYEVHVASLTKDVLPNVYVHYLMSSNKSDEDDLKKIGYIFTVFKINKLYKKLNPDIVSVHYATSYGFLAALSRISKYSLSVWGTDVYAFPQKSIIHKLLVKYSLKKATILLSTSKAMANECKHYTNRDFYITPFGVNMDLFSPTKRERQPDNRYIISTMKSLSPEYGIDVLLRALRELLNNYPQIELYTYIAGEGPSAESLKDLSRQLKLEKNIEWLGLVPQSVVIDKLVNSDVAVIPSYRESFGVSAVEAQACGIPVIISNVDGLKEATSPEESSLVFEAGNHKKLSEALALLYFDEQRRNNMGFFARKYVIERFDYTKCFQYIEKILNEF